MMNRTTAVLGLLVLLLVALGPSWSGAAVWLAPEWERPRPGTPAPAIPATSIDLAGGRGEWTAFLVVARADTVRLSIAPSFPLEVFPLLAHFVEVNVGSPRYATLRNPGEGPGRYPDALLPYSGLDVAIPPGECQVWWLDVLVPRAIDPGQYTITVRVIADGVESELRADVTVWAWTAPLTPAAESCILYWPPEEGGFRGDEEANRLMLAHLLTPFAIPKAQEADFIAEFGLARNTVEGAWSGADATTCEMSPAPTAAEVAAMREGHDARLDLRGYTADEIGECPLLDEVREWGAALHGSDIDQLCVMPPRFELLDDGSGTRPAVDLFAILPKQYVAADVAAAIAAHSKVLSYLTLQQPIYRDDGDWGPFWLLDYPYPNWALVPGFLNWKHGLGGVLVWRADKVNPARWDDVEFFRPSMPGEALWLYDHPTLGKCASQRLKWLRRGVQDYGRCALLEAAGERAWALSVVETVAPNWWGWETDPAEIEKARRTLGQRLHELALPVGPASADGSTVLTVESEDHEIALVVDVIPQSTSSGGVVICSAVASCLLEHRVDTWAWDDGGAGGTFDPSPRIATPLYRAPRNRTGRPVTITLRVTATCDGGTFDVAAKTLRVRGRKKVI